MAPSGRIPHPLSIPPSPARGYDTRPLRSQFPIRTSCISRSAPKGRFIPPWSKAPGLHPSPPSPNPCRGDTHPPTMPQPCPFRADSPSPLHPPSPCPGPMIHDPYEVNFQFVHHALPNLPQRGDLSHPGAKPQTLHPALPSPKPRRGDMRPPTMPQPCPFRADSPSLLHPPEPLPGGYDT